MSDLREAATRLKLTSGLKMKYGIHDGLWFSLEDFADMRSLITAWIAEHPADSDEPITEEWAESEMPKYGFKKPFPREYHKGNVTFYLKDVPALTWRVTVQSLRFPDVRTRAQLRQILSALGIRKETP